MVSKLVNERTPASNLAISRAVAAKRPIAEKPFSEMTLDELREKAAGLQKKKRFAEAAEVRGLAIRLLLAKLPPLAYRETGQGIELGKEYLHASRLWTKAAEMEKGTGRGEEYGENAYQAFLRGFDFLLPKIGEEPQLVGFVGGLERDVAKPIGEHSNDRLCSGVLKVASLCVLTSVYAHMYIDSLIEVGMKHPDTVKIKRAANAAMRRADRLSEKLSESCTKEDRDFMDVYQQYAERVIRMKILEI